MDFEKDILLSQFVQPFKNMNQFFKALQIINLTFSSISRNLNSVAMSIFNILNDSSLLYQDIRDFVERVTLMPTYYGENFFEQQADFVKICSLYETSNKSHTCVLTPELTKCVFCKDVELVIKGVRYAKNPIIYSRDKIGITNSLQIFSALIDFLTHQINITQYVGYPLDPPFFLLKY